MFIKNKITVQNEYFKNELRLIKPSLAANFEIC